MNSKNKELLERAQEVFFEAMVNGWANPSIQKTQILPLPGLKSIPALQKDGFIVMDFYFTHPESPFSTGSTVITHNDGISSKTIWVMHYGGWYKKEAIPFLKEVLYTTYKKGYFSGGRGINPSKSKNDSFLYINKTERNLFSDFKGREEIYDENGASLGFHEYFGMSLLPE